LFGPNLRGHRQRRLPAQVLAWDAVALTSHTAVALYLSAGRISVVGFATGRDRWARLGRGAELLLSHRTRGDRARSRLRSGNGSWRRRINGAAHQEYRHESGNAEHARQYRCRASVPLCLECYSPRMILTNHGTHAAAAAISSNVSQPSREPQNRPRFKPPCCSLRLSHSRLTSRHEQRGVGRSTN
jgi:hypothetical protein